MVASLTVQPKQQYRVFHRAALLTKLPIELWRELVAVASTGLLAADVDDIDDVGSLLMVSCSSWCPPRGGRCRPAAGAGWCILDEEDDDAPLGFDLGAATATRGVSPSIQ